MIVTGRTFVKKRTSQQNALVKALKVALGTFSRMRAVKAIALADYYGRVSAPENREKTHKSAKRLSKSIESYIRNILKNRSSHSFCFSGLLGGNLAKVSNVTSVFLSRRLLRNTLEI